MGASTLAAALIHAPRLQVLKYVAWQRSLRRGWGLYAPCIVAALGPVRHERMRLTLWAVGAVCLRAYVAWCRGVASRVNGAAPRA